MMLSAIQYNSKNMLLKQAIIGFIHICTQCKRIQHTTTKCMHTADLLRQKQPRTCGRKESTTKENSGKQASRQGYSLVKATLQDTPKDNQNTKLLKSQKHKCYSFESHRSVLSPVIIRRFRRKYNEMRALDRITLTIP